MAYLLVDKKIRHVKAYLLEHSVSDLAQADIDRTTVIQICFNIHIRKSVLMHMDVLGTGEPKEL